MGIFGALTTAVSGIRAQSFALENVSGNIANSQTTAFKRIDSSFVDLIPDEQASKQVAGQVVAQSRSTNTVQGDIQSASIDTFMAINGDGYFVIQKPSNFADGRPVFDGIERYGRRGDFQTDKNGFLVNGAGYYLMGIPVDRTTGNLVGSVPQVLQFQNDFLPAEPTTQINYRANLARFPLTASADTSVARSELLNQAMYSANPVAGPAQPAKITGIGASTLPDAPAVVTGTVDLTAFNSGGVATNLQITGTGTANIAVPPGTNAAGLVALIDAQSGVTNVDASLDGSNHLVLTGMDNDTNVTIGGLSTPGLLTAIGHSLGTTNATNLLTQGVVTAPQTLTVKVAGNPTLTVTFGFGGGQTSTLAELNAALGGLVGGTASVDPLNGNVTITAGNLIDSITVGGTADAGNFGIQTLTAFPSDGSVHASDEPTFLSQSLSGGAITVFDISGSPMNMQLRWAKVDSALYPPGVDTWNLFYLENANATGTQPKWRNVGTDYVFGPNGQMNPAISQLTLTNVTINNVVLGDIQLFHGAGGMTQFADPNGNVQVNLLEQNGFAAGELQSIAVNDKGRITGTYSNGRTLDLAEITLAAFNGSNYLKRIDGGAFEITDESGPAIYGASGKIVGSSLEGSNTDIADEFTKLIVTQQAYSANTRVITTTNQMVQDLLNMLR
jgi:flagellar hook protein FlgE